MDSELDEKNPKIAIEYANANREKMVDYSLLYCLKKKKVYIFEY